MPVSEVQGGVVVRVFRDVATLLELQTKYGLTGSQFVELDARAGQLWDGSVLSDVSAPAPRDMMVDAEAQRRINVLTSPSLQLQMTVRGVQLVRIIAEGGTWTAEQQAEADALEAAAAATQAIRTAAATLKATPGGIPSNYTDNSYWP